MLKFLNGLYVIYLVLAWILGVLIHLWTISIAFTSSGLLGAIVSFFLPIGSELYWGVKAFIFDGFNTSYIQWLIVLFLMWLLHYVFAFLLVWIEEKTNKEINY